MRVPTFLFHTGAIKSVQTITSMLKQPCFYSTLVRLKGFSIGFLSDPRYLGFYSTLVRLKVI